MDSLAELLFDLFSSLIDLIYSKCKSKRYKKKMIFQNAHVFFRGIVAFILTIGALSLLYVLYCCIQ